jgi:hypothetical protein
MDGFCPLMSSMISPPSDQESVAPHKATCMVSLHHLFASKRSFTYAANPEWIEYGDF